MKRLLSFVGLLIAVAGFGFWLRPISYFEDFTHLEEALSGVHSRTIRVNDYRIHYEVEGPANGPPVVLIHGLGGSADGWRALAPYLKHAGFRIYMPDLVGYGSSDKPRNFSYSVRDEAAIVVGFLNALGLKRVDLAGWSMGGWIVQLVAAGSPDRVNRLVLFDSAGLYEAPTWDTHLFMPANVDQLNKLDALLMPKPPRLPAFVAEDVLRVSKQDDWVIHRALDQMWTAKDVTDGLLPQLTVPLLIEWGADDRIVPIDQGERIHRLVRGSMLDVYRGCGHLAPLQCANEMGPPVVAFLSVAGRKQPQKITVDAPRAIATGDPAGN